MSVHSSQKYKNRDWSKIKFAELGTHKDFLERITKTFYYGNLPLTERLSLPLTERAADLFSEVKARHSVERLRLDEASEISRNACVSPCSLVLAIIYLEHLKVNNHSYVDKVSPSDLFIVSLIVATKFLNDSGEEEDILNTEWASSVGLTLEEVNRLEREFLSAIKWEVYVGQNSFWKRLRMLERDVAFKEGNKRGWFSYTDLEKLLDTINALALAQTLFTVSAVCLASYTAGLLTIVGSTFLVSQMSRYSISSQLSPDLPSDVFNGTITQPPVHFDTKDSCVPIAEFVLPLINYEYKESAYTEGTESFKETKINWNLEDEQNLTNYENNYFSFVSNYLKVLSTNIEYLPLKIGTKPVESCFLNNCYS